MKDVIHRIVRIERIERYLAANRQGYTTSELAQLLAVSPFTILRDLDLLEHLGTGFVKQGRRYIVHHFRPRICQQCGIE